MRDEMERERERDEREEEMIYKSAMYKLFV